MIRKDRHLELNVSALLRFASLGTGTTQTFQTLEAMLAILFSVDSLTRLTSFKTAVLRDGLTTNVDGSRWIWCIEIACRSSYGNYCDGNGCLHTSPGRLNTDPVSAGVAENAPTY